MQAQVQEQVKTFAKANKIGAAKLQEFVDGLLSQVKPVSTGMGRAAKQTTLALRESLPEFVQAREYVTSRDVVEAFGCGLSDANNTLRWMHQKGLVKPADIELPRSRGRKASVWCKV